jgi:hypothetical protein
VSVGSIQHWRRRLLLAGLVPLTLTLLFVAKVVLMTWHDADARSAFDEGRTDDAVAEYQANGRANVLEPWVAHYGEGTARVAGLDYTAAIPDLEAAVREVPSDQECRVRVNLAMALEGAGVETGMSRVGAIKGWARAREILADGGCLDDEVTGKAARTVDRRLQELITEVLAAEPSEEPTPEPTQGPGGGETEGPLDPEETPSGDYEW